MKKVLFLVVLVLGFLFLNWNAPRSFGPELLEAGCGLRVDVPYGRIDCFDSGGRWSDDPRRFDPHFNGTYGGYGIPFSQGSAYSRDGTTIINPAPGTTMKVVKKGGGLICLGGLLSIFGCGEETVDFSTAPRSSPTPTPAPAQQPPLPAPSEKIKEEILP